MDITIKITEHDYLHYAFMHIRKWRSKVYYLVLFIITVVTGVTALVVTGNPGLSFTRIVGIILLALPFFYMLVMAVSYVRLKSEYASNSILHEQIAYTFSSEGISAATTVSQAQITWNRVVHVKQSQQMIAIYISNSQAYILPKKQMSTTQMNQLFDILRTHVSPLK